MVTGRHYSGHEPPPPHVQGCQDKHFAIVGVPLGEFAAAAETATGPVTSFRWAGADELMALRGVEPFDRRCRAKAAAGVPRDDGAASDQVQCLLRVQSVAL